MHIDSSWFQIGPVPIDAIYGTYNYGLVALSYVIAVFASYVALDFAGQLRTESEQRTKLYWLLGGAFAMGAGIWSMHFIGMLAFDMPMSMPYDLFWTVSSMVVAIIVAGFALFLLQKTGRALKYMVMGGALLGLGIATMHYMGMEGMKIHTNISYIPSLFVLSIVIGIIASEVALWLVLKSTQGSFKTQLRLKILSALIMGAAICGMHYTGMAAAIFTPLAHTSMHTMTIIEPYTLAFYIAGTTGLIILIALVISAYKQFIVAAQNEKDFLNGLLDNLSDGVLACDSKGRITVFNHALQEMLKFPLDSPFPKEWNKYFSLTDPSDRRIVTEDERPLFRALRGERIQDLELELELKGRKNKYNIIVDGQAIINRQGKKIGAVIAIHDVTKRKKSERDIELLHQQILESARRAGMADVATSILHNIGNVLNSANVSMGLLQEILGQQHHTKLITIGSMMKEHMDNIGDYLLQDSKGKLIPQYLVALVDVIEKDFTNMNQEISNLSKQLQHIRDIVAAQQSVGGVVGFSEKVFLPEVLDVALKMSGASLENPSLKVEKTFEEMPFILVDKSKLLQILVNLIKNAKDSLIECNQEGQKKLMLSIKKNPSKVDTVNVTVSDNGMGISKENLIKIFSFGFTTKKQGHGFGLHSCALVAKELGGDLQVVSDGVGKGAAFILRLPLNMNKGIDHDSK